MLFNMFETLWAHDSKKRFQIIATGTEVEVIILLNHILLYSWI